MNHIIILFHFISFTSGIGLITLAYYFFIKSKSEVIRHIIFADMFYTVILLIDTLQLYAKKNILIHYPFLSMLANTIFFISVLGMMYYLTYTIHTLTGRVFSITNKKVFCIISVFFALVPIVLMVLNNLGITQYTHVGKIINFYLYTVSLYNTIFLIINFKTIQTPAKTLIKVCSISIFVILTISICANIFDTLPMFIYKIPYIPLLYFFINTFGLIYIKNHAFHGEIIENNEPVSMDSKTIDIYNELSKEYGITEREVEIIKFIVDGCSNQEISSKLFISINTVKNHIYNIYKKIGIKNRYELISILSKAQNEKQNANKYNPL